MSKPTENKPRLQMAVRYSLKNMPESHLGLVGENCTYGRECVPFARLSAGIICQIAEYYTIFTDTDELNAELEKLREWLVGVRIDPVEIPDDTGQEKLL